ncbi:MAG: hypothetical protein ACLR3C_14275, partial [Eggerthella lenta]
IILCQSVMAVLSATTAQATYSAAEKQALFTNDTYQNEQAAQSAVAVIDAALEDVRASGGGLDEALAAVDEALPADAQRDGSRVLMTFASSSGRTLDVELTITANATYEISQWKATTQWTNDTGCHALVGRHAKHDRRSTMKLEQLLQRWWTEGIRRLHYRRTSFGVA